MSVVSDLVKNFRTFCNMIEGKYVEAVFPRCVKTGFYIELNYLDQGESLGYIGIDIVSETGDVTSFKIKNVWDVKVYRATENDDTGAMRYYSLVIETNKGTIKLKKDLREKKLVLEYETPDIQYVATTLL